MDTTEEAADYNSMDHSEVNRGFVGDFLESVGRSPLGNRLHDDAECPAILDAGTGTALIPMELCNRGVHCHVTACDLSEEMLKLAKENVQQAGLSDRITLEHFDAKRLPFPDNDFDAVIANSIVHHIPEPREVLAEMCRVLRPGGVLFVRDLVRPHDVAAVDQLVEKYTGGENDHQRQMFRDSLHAALTVHEVRELLISLDLPAHWVRQTTDRHCTIVGTAP